MIIIILFSILTFVLLYLNFKGNKQYSSENDDNRGICVGIMTLVFALFLIVHTFAYFAQLKNINQIYRLDKTIEIYSDKFENLKITLDEYLNQIYLKHESKIFENISPSSKNLKMYFSHYPEIVSSKTLIKLAEELVKLQNDLYDEKIKREWVLTNIRLIEQNLFILPLLLPSSKN